MPLDFDPRCESPDNAVSAASKSKAGISLKAPYVEALLNEPPQVGFLEIHAENYFGDGGAPHAHLTLLREKYPLSIHGVTLSLGGVDSPDEVHLGRLAALIGRYEPMLFSEHLAWSSHEGVYLTDLLPLQYDTTALTRVCDHIDLVQERLGIRLLLENPATYLAHAEST